MYLPKSLNAYIKNKEKEAPRYIVEINSILRRSGFENYMALLTDDSQLVLLDMSQDIMPGVVIKKNAPISFKETENCAAVTTNSRAKCKILNSISHNEDLEKVKEIFKGTYTWVIYSGNKEDGSFEAYTDGMANYSHPDFRIRKDIGKEEIAFVLNSLCKRVQKGNVFEDKNRIKNLYENYDILLIKTEDGFFDVELIDEEAPLEIKEDAELDNNETTEE